MKNILKKNQLMITALAIMIAIAGYLQFAGGSLEDDYLEIQDDYLQPVEGNEIITIDSLEPEEIPYVENYLSEGEQSFAAPSQQEIPGEAIFTSSMGVEILTDAKLLKEQTRAKNKETLMSVINSTSLSDAQKAEAVNSMVAMTEIAEKEAAAEILLQAKGFSDVVVSIHENSADVVVNASELSEAQRAQIEDIVKRKTDVAPENIIISTVVYDE